MPNFFFFISDFLFLTHTHPYHTSVNSKQLLISFDTEICKIYMLFCLVFHAVRWSETMRGGRKKKPQCVWLDDSNSILFTWVTNENSLKPHVPLGRWTSAAAHLSLVVIGFYQATCKTTPLKPITHHFSLHVSLCCFRYWHRSVQKGNFWLYGLYEALRLA